MMANNAGSNNTSTVGEEQTRQICSFCYATSFTEAYPPSWVRVVRTAAYPQLIEALDACPACVKRMDAASSYSFTPRGAYATGQDPRGEPVTALAVGRATSRLDRPPVPQRPAP
jgi:hypothetical protein